MTRVLEVLKQEAKPGVNPVFGDVTGRRNGYRTRNPQLNEMIRLFWGYGKLYTRADQLYEAYTGSRNVPRVDGRPIDKWW